MNLNEAKEKVSGFLESNFSLDNYDIFLKYFGDEEYPVLEASFFQAYGNGFFKRFESVSTTLALMILMDAIFLRATSLDQVCRKIACCGEEMQKKGYLKEADSFFVLLNELEAGDGPQTKTHPLTNLETDQTRSIEDSFKMIGPWWTEHYLSQPSPAPYSGRPKQP